MEDIFTLDEQGNLTIDKDYVRGLPEFKRILERDKGSEGDAQGRKKLRAFSEFMYIKLVGDMFSYLNTSGYSEKEIQKLAIKDSKLEADFKPDIDIIEGIKKYSEVQLLMFPALSTVKTSLRGLRMSDILAQKMINNMEKVMELHEARQTDPNAPPNIADDLALITNLSSQLDTLINISVKLPKMIDTLESLEQKLATQKSGTQLGRGGRKLGNRAEPKS